MIRYFDMFAGVGGFRAGLDLAGGFACVGHCEIDKYADASYRAIHNIEKEEKYYRDAREIDPDDMPAFDLLCGGFPCQSFSNAGKRLGFDDARGTLFFELARLAQRRKPSYLLFENVPGLLSHDKGRTFSAILATLHDMGYGVEWAVLNSKHFGVPQSRKRVFIIGYLDQRCAGKILPVFGTNGKALIQLASGPQGSRVYDPEGVACTQTSVPGGMGGKTGLYFVGFNRKDGVTGELKCAHALQASDFRGIDRNQTQNAVLETDEPCFVDLCYGHPELTDTARCLTANYNKSRMSSHKGEMSGVLEPEAACAVLNPDREKVRQQGRRIKRPNEPMFTLTAQDKHGVLLIKEATKRGYKEAIPGDTVDLGYVGSNTRRGRVGRDIAHTLDTGSSTQGVIVKSGKIRRLMPRECFRLQGFTDEQIDKILAITSDAQAYRQAGNGVTVNVIHAIGLRIRAVDEAIKAGELT